MDYQKAKDLRNKSFSDLMTDKLTGGQGIGSSLRETLSEKTKAKMTGIKETFDPMNIVKTMTFGSKLGPALYGKMMGRSKEDMKYFTDKKTRGPGKNKTPGQMDSQADSMAVDALGLIYRLMLRNQEDEKLRKEEEKGSIEEKDSEEELRNQELVKALTARRKKEKPKKEKPTKEEPKPEPKKEPPPKEKPKKGGKKEEAPKPTKEKPKVEKVPPKESPKAPEKVPAKEAPPAPKPPTEKAPAPKPSATKPSAEKATPKVPSPTGAGQGVKDMIKQHEGNIPFPYKDTKGLWTIGVGHLIGDGKSLPPQYDAYKNNGGPYDKKNNTTPAMTQAEIDALFEKDFESHKQMAMKTPGWDKANDSGQAAMIDLAYNMGGSWYKTWPTTAKALDAGDFESAAEGLKNSKWYTQVKGRAVKIVDMIRNGSKQNTPGTPTNQSLPATLTPSTGSKIEQSSKENKDLKESLNKDKPKQSTVNNTTVSAENKETKQSTETVDDRPAHLKKKG